jgi:hypothetical protein
MWSKYLGDLRVDRHHLIIQRNTYSLLLGSWSHALLRNFHRCMQLVWSPKAGCPSISFHRWGIISHFPGTAEFLGTNHSITKSTKE